MALPAWASGGDGGDRTGDNRHSETEKRRPQPGDASRPRRRQHAPKRERRCVPPPCSATSTRLAWQQGRTQPQTAQRQVGAAGARPNRAKTKKEKMHGGGRGAPKERSGSSPQRTWLSAAAGHRGATPVPAASGPPLAARRSPTGRSPTCVSPRRRAGPPLWRCRHHARAAAGRTAAIGRHGRRGRRGRR